MAVFPSTATLLFKVPTTYTVGDSGVLQTTAQPLIVLAYLTQQSARALPEGALELGQIALKGRCNSPPALPNSLQLEQAAECILWRIGGGFTLPASNSEWADVTAYQTWALANAAHIDRQGTFLLGGDTWGAYGVEAVLGAKLSGVLATKAAWGNAL